MEFSQSSKNRQLKVLSTVSIMTTLGINPLRRKLFARSGTEPLIIKSHVLLSSTKRDLLPQTSPRERIAKDKHRRLSGGRVAGSSNKRGLGKIPSKLALWKKADSRQITVYRFNEYHHRQAALQVPRRVPGQKKRVKGLRMLPFSAKTGSRGTRFLRTTTTDCRPTTWQQRCRPLCLWAIQSRNVKWPRGSARSDVA